MHPARFPHVPVAVAAIVVAACGDGGSSPTQSPIPVPPHVAELRFSNPTPLEGVSLFRLPDSVTVRAVSEEGKGVRGIQIRFSAEAGSGSFSPAVAATDSLGYARSAWTPGAGSQQQGSASIAGLTPLPLRASTIQVSPGVASMLGQLDLFIKAQLQDLQAAAPNNPKSTEFFQAKIAMLKAPGLANDVVRGKRWVEGTAQSASGRQVPIVALFALDSMEAETRELVTELAASLPVTESFMGTPYPPQATSVWNGFRIGSYSAIAVEDRGSFEARTKGNNGPYEAVAHHELGHHWMMHESLNQVLELYSWNVVHGYGTDPLKWGFTRNWSPGASTNTGVQALLDVYVLLGRDRMSRIYQAIYPMRPPYGQPLPDPVRQVFVEQAPDSVKAQVAARLAKVDY